MRARFGIETFVFAAFLIVLALTVAWPDRVSADWVRRYGFNRGGGKDESLAVAVDKEGNVYVTGSSESLSASRSGFLTAKYDKSGRVRWAVRYDGTLYSDERANAIAVDNVGNVYVTGKTSLNMGDYLTIKYDTNGVKKWVRTYNGQASGSDEATALAVDAAGNVYVTGYSEGKNSDYSEDFLTIRYNADGKKIWERRHRNPYMGSGSRVHMALDPSGNVCITGNIKERVASGCLTIIYDRNGRMLWKQQYRGPSNIDSFVTALAVDAFGNIYLAGYSAREFENADFLTIKYNAKGVRKWVRRYGGPKEWNDLAMAIAVTDRGHVYVTGSSDTARGTEYYSDYVTIKYDTNGSMLWKRHYDGPTQADDRPTAISVDGGGNVCVTGYSALSRFNHDERVITTVKYDSRGVKLWEQRSDESSLRLDPGSAAMALDAEGNIHITGTVGGIGDPDFLIAKYDAEGAKIWQQRCDGPGWGMNEPKAIAADGSGNIYVTGASLGQIDWDYVTIKYNTSGVTEWRRRYGEYPELNDFAQAMALDAAGNIYVTGYSSSPTSDDYLTIKYDTNGTVVWKQSYDGLANGIDFPTAMAVDATGNVFVTGSSSREVPSWPYGDFLTIKYDTNGTKLWEQSYDGGGNYGDCPTAIALDKEGNVHVTGKSYISNNWDICTIKYDTSGQEVWRERYDAGRFRGDRDDATGIAIDGSGNVFVSGCSRGVTTDEDYLTVKYDRDGRKIWERFYDGRLKGKDCATAIALDASGNVYVTGYSKGATNGAPSSFDYLTIKYDTDGRKMWVRSYDAGIRAGDDLPSSLVLDADANVYITGYSEGSHTYYRKDFLTIKYDTNGGKVWERRYDGPVGGDDSAVAIVLDAMRNVYVTGASASFNFSDFLTIKYEQEQPQFFGPRLAP